MKKSMQITKIWGFLFFLLTAMPALAARPFVTDDARLTTAGSCQVESWSRLYMNTTEFWALPACNPSGNFEVSAGAGFAKNNDERGTRDYVLQVKSLFKELTTNSWGVGITAGMVHHPQIRPGPNQLGNLYVNIPYSVSFRSDNLIVHANLGWLRDRETGKYSTTWGLGGEFIMTSRVTGIFEVFGDNRNSPYTQGGIRYAVIPGLFQIDTTIGTQASGTREDTWLSFGLRFTPDHL